MKKYKKESLRNISRAIKHIELRKAKSDPNIFMEYAFELKLEPFHKEAQNTMLTEQYSIIMLPRDHGKTTIVESFIIWCLGNNPDLRVKIVCETDDRAMERLTNISRHIRTNKRIREVFPELIPDRKSDWTKHKISVKRDNPGRDASIEALGILSSSTGGRADIIVADDAVGRRNAIDQPKMRNSIKEAWKSDWVNLLDPPNDKIIWICTPWHTADLSHELEKNSQYKVYKRSVGKKGDQFAPLWPEKWGREELKRRYNTIGQIKYDMAFRLVALSASYVVVHREWIKYWDRRPDKSKLQFFIAFDTSSGEGNDFFATVTIGVDPQSLNIYVFDGWHQKLTFLDQAGAIKQEAHKWKPMAMGIEKDPINAIYQYLRKTTMLRLIPLSPRASKSLRLSSVTPALQRGQVFFNPELNPDNIDNAEELGDLVSELIEFPLSANDDLVDAFAHVMNLASYYVGYNKEYNEDDEEEDDVGGIEIEVDIISIH